MKTVYFDVDTQIDFVLPAGALYAPGAERILERVAALNRHAAATGSVVISTTDAHAEDDPEFREWPGHCIAGTLGQRKPESTLLRKQLVLPSRKVAVGVEGCEQIVIEKQHLDCFTNANLADVLTTLPADRFVVYGVVTEYCVRFAAFGLLETGKRVEIVEDAVRSLDEAKAWAMFKEFRGRGGHVVPASSILDV